MYFNNCVLLASVLFFFIFVSRFAWKLRWCLLKLYFHLIMKITQCLLFFNFWEIDKFTFSKIVAEVQVCFHRSSRKQLYLLHFSVSSFFLSSKSHSYSEKKLKKKKEKDSWKLSWTHIHHVDAFCLHSRKGHCWAKQP